MTIVFEHLLGNVPGNVHDGLIARAALGKVGDQCVPVRAGAKIDHVTPLTRRHVVYFCSGAYIGWMSMVNRLRNRSAEVPVKWGFSRTELD